MARTRKVQIAVAIACLAAALQAQPDRVPSGPPAPSADYRVFDKVIHVFGDRAILESSIRAELESRIIGERNAGRRITPEFVDYMRYHILQQRQRTEALARSARTMSGDTSDKVDSFVDRYVEDETRKEVERAGSLNKLTEELGILGKTLDSVNEARRTKALADIAVRESLRRRWTDRFALIVTPREMKRFYDENIDQFVQEESADLEIVAIRRGADAEASRQAAELAAESWRSSEETAEALADRVGGIALDTRPGVRNVESDSNPAALKEFAADSPVGAVSEPILRGGAYWILKVVARRAGRNESFENPVVQKLILDRLVSDRITAEENRLILRTQQRFRPISPRGVGR